MDTQICHYRCHRKNLCCWLCDARCRQACNFKCVRLLGIKRVVTIIYAAKNQAPDPKWCGLKGQALIQGRGPGPRNVLVDTELGTVVVPRGNLKWK